MKLVAVSCDRRRAGPVNPGPRTRPPRPEVWVKEAVVSALRRVGLEPLLLPPGPADPTRLVALLLDRVDAVVLTGGAFDIHPSHYGAAVQGRLDRIDEGRTALELALAAACIDQGVPVLGLCGGQQALAVAAGGTLVGDLAADHPCAQEHEQPTDPASSWHPVRLARGRLRAAFDRDEIAVNSTHHQAVSDPGSMRVTGWSPDGVVEATELDAHRFCVGVQWHPELLPPDPHHAPFRALAAAIR